MFVKYAVQFSNLTLIMETAQDAVPCFLTPGESEIWENPQEIKDGTVGSVIRVQAFPIPNQWIIRNRQVVRS